MSSTVADEVTAVIRSAGERTEAACNHLLSSQVSEENISVIHERPFTKALERTFEIGMQRGRPWTLVVDADVLIRDGAISQILEMAEQAEDNVFEVQGRMLDKLFGGARPCGLHLYRTALLPEAIDCIPAQGVTMRPETLVLRRMASRGYPWVQEEIVVGLHDYEQYYRDIYRKAFAHAHKHGRYVPHLESLWRRLAEEDPDYQVALWGLRAGQIFDGTVKIGMVHRPLRWGRQHLDNLT